MTTSVYFLLIQSFSPKQGSMLQVSIPTLSPLQGRPPNAGGGSVPERYLLLTPTSHVRLQALHCVQLLQPQSTEKHRRTHERRRRKIKWQAQTIKQEKTETEGDSNTHRGRELSHTAFLHRCMCCLTHSVRTSDFTHRLLYLWKVRATV